MAVLPRPAPRSAGFRPSPRAASGPTRPVLDTLDTLDLHVANTPIVELLHGDYGAIVQRPA